MTPATLPPPKTTIDPPAPGPLFRIGQEVRVGYMGVYEWGEVPDFADSGIAKTPARIVGLRLTPVITEGDDGAVQIAYPTGWEYQLFRADDKNNGDRGWWSEAFLFGLGYKPA